MDRATVDHLLTTTRTVRRRLDLSKPVEPEVIQECLEVAIQAPNGGNQNRYHFVVVTDPVKRAAIGAIYKKVFYQEHVPLSGAGDPGLSRTGRGRRIRPPSGRADRSGAGSQRMDRRSQPLGATNLRNVQHPNQPRDDWG